jgi:hypothetical protein
MAKILRGLHVMLVGGGLAVVSCSADRASVPVSREADANVTATSAQTLTESAGAAARIAELRARFRLALSPAPGSLGFAGAHANPAAPPATILPPVLGMPAATRFEAAGGADARTHVRAVLPAEARRGIRRTARVALPVSANDEVKLEDEVSHVSVRFALEFVRDARIEVATGMALYRGALNGADVIHRVHVEGTEDFVVFEQPPAREELRYSVDVSRAAGLRLVSNTLEFLDESGSPALRIAPPYVVDARGGHHEAKLAVTGCAYGDNPASPWGRTVTKAGAERCTVNVTWSGVAYPALVDPAWVATGSMVTARSVPSASVLLSGKVLIAGGSSVSIGALTSAELFDPTANGGVGAFAATGSMATARIGHTASVLPSGKVLITGGSYTNYYASAELFDPAANGGVGAFVATGSMATARTDHVASVLASGKVLVTGGEDAGGQLASAEIFDAAANGGAGAFVATGSMAAARSTHTASVLASGKVLVTGGRTPASVQSAELFDPAANGGVGAFAATGSMASPREGHTASVLASGKVLVTGGYDPTLQVTLASAELFNPAANNGVGAFVATGSMTTPRQGHTASVLPSGKILVAGGVKNAPPPGSLYVGLGSAELYDAAADGGVGAFAATASMSTEHANDTASVLPSGKVLLVTPPELYGPKLGDPCTTSAECLSSFCSDGLCCDSACGGGSCQRCDLPGTEGTCSIAPAKHPGASQACAPFACDGVNATCPTACTSDTTCSGNDYCAANGTCQTRRPQAASCNAETDCKAAGSCQECASGFCVDGVCCEAACGTCQACVGALKQSGGDGTCGPIKDGTDPHNECPASTVPCGPNGMCNGAGACRPFAPAGVSCNDGKVCDGAGKCALLGSTCDGDHTVRSADGSEQDCAPYKCESNGTCRSSCTSVVDCIAPAVCSASGKCEAPQESGNSGGCAVGRARGESSTFLGAFLVLLAVARRRAHPRR